MKKTFLKDKLYQFLKKNWKLTWAAKRWDFKIFYADMLLRFQWHIGGVCVVLP